ncbi:hypothetical protein BROUX41_002868 [Berkeleyomyces rouxiae]|uniref:uncharacterized protein n=1 Tax=Berkeleyomyces rouxiae TaxID=2035830 RepID=UPI003B7AA93E
MATSKRSFYVVLCAVAVLIMGVRVKSFADRLFQVAGIWRIISPTLVSKGDGFVYIPDTIQCEDLHYHERSGLIFTACEDNRQTRLSWFPPLGIFDDPVLGQESQGSIHIVNPNTFTSTRLDMENFNGPFSTHGIDVITDPQDAQAVYIFAINHAPHMRYLSDFAAGKPTKHLQKAQSVVELFHHKLWSTSVRHIRTIQHPLIATPNDVFASSPKSFFVTNDHHYREGPMRLVEDMYMDARWTNTIHVAVTDMTPASGAPQDGVEASVALDNIHNNNGLGHGQTPDEILITDTMGGKLLIGKISANNQIRIVDSFDAPATIDNPSYFVDPYGDKMGIVLPSIGRLLELSSQMQDPQHKISSLVMMVSPERNTTSNVISSSSTPRTTSQWHTDMLFEDDGSRLSTASGAVLIPIPPAKTVGNKRQAWLFATGFMSHSMAAVRVGL